MGRRDFFRKTGVGLVAAVTARYAAGCGQRPDPKTLKLLSEYVDKNKTDDPDLTEFAESYQWDNDHSFREDLKYFNDNLHNNAGKDSLEKHGFYKGRKINNTDKAAAAKRFRAWAENGRDSF